MLQLKIPHAATMTLHSQISKYKKKRKKDVISLQLIKINEKKKKGRKRPFDHPALMLSSSLHHLTARPSLP